MLVMAELLDVILDRKMASRLLMDMEELVGNHMYNIQHIYLCEFEHSCPLNILNLKKKANFQETLQSTHKSQE